ncbi:hypothetical protein KSP40_PGU010912 [Platanthera guangdongensis]|uniref:Uncharacterized protein n=1 Tax=Platanthera guangdongensis TaxID=2320717 RepID=A0ABR2MRL4_9ASPA
MLGFLLYEEVKETADGNIEEIKGHLRTLQIQEVAAKHDTKERSRRHRTTTKDGREMAPSAETQVSKSKDNETVSKNTENGISRDKKKGYSSEESRTSNDFQLQETNNFGVSQISHEKAERFIDKTQKEADKEVESRGKSENPENSDEKRKLSLQTEKAENPENKQNVDGRGELATDIEHELENEHEHEIKHKYEPEIDPEHEPASQSFLHLRNHYYIMISCSPLSCRVCIL